MTPAKPTELATINFLVQIFSVKKFLQLENDRKGLLFIDLLMQFAFRINIKHSDDGIADKNFKEAAIFNKS